MEGAGTLSSDESDSPRRHGSGRRRRGRSRGLSEKIRRSHKAAQIRRIITVVVLGGAVVAASIYVANNSAGYEPIPIPSAE
jgi:hypothetical protein